MPEAEFETYLAAMAKLLRLSPKQRDAIAGELRDHLESRLAELQAMGVERDEAVRRALDEFGDAAVLSDELVRPRQDLKRRRLMQGSLATAALAAIAVLITTSLLPTNNPASVPPVVAEGGADAAAEIAAEVVAEGGGTVTQKPGGADAASAVVIEADRVTLHSAPVVEREGGFVYLSGLSGLARRPGAYALPKDSALTLPQLLASAGGLAEGVAVDGLVVEVVRRVPEFGEASATIRVPYSGVAQAVGLTLAADDLVVVKPAAEPALDYEPEVLIVDMNTIVPSLIEDPGELNEVVFSDWWRDRQAELAEHVGSVLHGLGYAQGRDVRSVNVWMGVLTITGSPVAVAAAERYLDQMRETLKQRSAEKRAASRLPIEAALEPIDREIVGLERSAGALNDALMQLGGPFQEDHPTTQRIRDRVDEIRNRVAGLHERRAELILQATDGAKAGAADAERMDRMVQWMIQNWKAHQAHPELVPLPEWWPVDGSVGFMLTQPAE